MPQMDNKKVIVFSLVSLLFVFLSLFSIQNSDSFIPYYFTRPAFLVFMMFMYVSLVQKPIKLFLLCQLLTAIGEFIQYFNISLFPLAILFYIIGLLLMIKVVFSFIRKVKIVDFLAYLLLYLFFFGVIFFVVLDNSIDKVSAFGYGLTFITLATLIFINFLMDMTKANLLLFVAIIIASISNSIISINVTEILTDKPVLTATTLTSMLTHYLVCLSFIYREGELKTK